MARDFLSDNTVQINVGSFGLHAVKTVTQKLEGDKSIVWILVLDVLGWIEQYRGSSDLHPSKVPTPNP